MTAPEFWEWFSANEGRLWHLRGKQSRLLSELQDRVSEYTEGLYVEVGDLEDGAREIVISAAGNRSLFRAAEALAAAAPPLRRWKVTPLKPARGFEFVLDAEGVHLDPERMCFRALSNEADPSALGIGVLVPFSSVDQRIHNAVLTLLETALGERTTANLAHVEVSPMPEKTADLLRLSDLGEYVEWFRRKALESGRGIH